LLRSVLVTSQAASLALTMQPSEQSLGDFNFIVRNAYGILAVLSYDFNCYHISTRSGLETLQRPNSCCHYFHIILQD
jgi:hypothetical protein